MKGNPHKKLTFEDKFSRRYACWVRNNRKAWHWFKRQNRKKLRRIMKNGGGLGRDISAVESAFNRLYAQMDGGADNAVD